jgi:ribosomal protein L31E
MEMNIHLRRGSHTAKLAVSLLKEFADRHLDE